MRADAAWSGAHGNCGDGRKFDEIDGRERAVRRVADVGKKMQSGKQERRAEFQRDFAHGQASEEEAQENETVIEAELHLHASVSGQRGDEKGLKPGFGRRATNATNARLN